MQQPQRSAYEPQRHPGWPPTKKTMSPGMLLLIVLGCLFGGCVTCGLVKGVANKRAAAAASASTVATLDPAAEAARRAAQQKAAEEAKAAKEKLAIETFPQRAPDIASAIKKAAMETDTAKWALANADLAHAEKSLADFRETSVATSTQFRELDTKANGLRKRIEPQVQKLLVAEQAAAEERDLKASAIAVTSSELFAAYDANEIAADSRYKGQKLLVVGTVASIDKDFLGGLILRLGTPNEFMSTMCTMKESEHTQLARLSKGERVRVLCTGHGMTLGSPSLADCAFR